MDSHKPMATDDGEAERTVMTIVDGVRRLGQYIVGETLGEGGFSVVKLGIVEATGEKVALKLLTKDKLHLSSCSRRQVEREIAAMTKIQHPNVIRLKEVDWDVVYVKRNGTRVEVIMVVLEFASGGELFDFLSYTGCFEESIARTYFKDLINGVGYCHSKGVVHRDLKPENILLDGSFTLKLADFGFSNVFTGNAHARMSTHVGTPGYMAPEMAKGGTYEPTATDIWSCGVIAFIMLAGFPPFQAPTMADWWFNKLASGKNHLFWQAHSRNAHFSESFKDLINRILNPDPVKRFTVADIRSHEWFNGPTLEGFELTNELSRRKREVDQAKAREKLERKQRLEAAAQAVGAVGGGLHEVVVRGEDADPDSDVLPSGVPLMGAWMLRDDGTESKETASTSSGAPLVLESLDMSSLCTSLGDAAFEADASDKPVPLKYDPGAGKACYTSFESAKDPTQLVDRISRAIAKLGGEYEVDDKVFKIKGRYHATTGPVVFTAQVFVDDSAHSTPISVVEFRRQRGDLFSYQTLFLDVCSQVVDMISDKRLATISPDSGPATAAPPAAALVATAV